MSKYIHLSIKEVVRETPNTITIHFWHPPHAAIPYQAGQFLTLMPVINGKQVRRAYSMSSSPQRDASIAVTVKRLAGGLVSNYLNDTAKPGDSIEVMLPMGTFSLVPDVTLERTIVLIGGGSGITPLMSMLKTVLPAETRSKVLLVYASRDEAHTIFREALDALHAQYAGRFEVAHLLSQPKAGTPQRLDNQTLTALLAKNSVPAEAEYYLCGPDGLMAQAKETILAFGGTKIHQEHFTAAQDEKPEDDGQLKPRTVKVHYEGATYDIPVAPNQTILEAALELDIDLPYSCQAGMCTACMGKCVAGKVKLDEEDGLTEKELAAGYILTCVAHPLTDGVVLELQ